MLAALRAELVLSRLNEGSDAGVQIERVRLGPDHMVVAYRHRPSNAISDQAYCGVDGSFYKAALKALMEMIEAEAFRQGAAKGHGACLTERSDGFAAWPRILNRSTVAIQKARIRARDEAFERYAWATWWDDQRVGHTLVTPSSHPAWFASSRGLLDAVGMPEGTEVFGVCPAIDEAMQALVVIVCAFLPDGGVVSGGACGRGKPANLIYRGASELVRHYLALKRLGNGGASPRSFYEERLLHFGRPSGAVAVRDRLSRFGSKRVKVSETQVDSSVESDYDDVAVVYRYLYRDQPPFVGGRLERFCL